MKGLESENLSFQTAPQVILLSDKSRREETNLCVCLNDRQKKKIRSVRETPENYFSLLMFMSHFDSRAGMQSWGQCFFVCLFFFLSFCFSSFLEVYLTNL